jgi:hypothetical protein
VKSAIRHILHPDRRTSTLYFDDDTRGEYFLRGGLCFPFTQVQADRYRTEGYALLVGYDVDTEMRVLLEFTPFTGIAHKVRADGTLEREGLCSFLATCWCNYGARTFYAHDEGALGDSFKIIVQRDEAIVPKPVFIDLVWPGAPGAAEQVIHHLVARKLLTGPKEFAEEMRKASAQGVGTPAKHALICALLGMEQHPWRKPREREVPQVRI